MRHGLAETARVPAPYSIAHTVEHHYDAPLGLGFLDVVREGGPAFQDSLLALELPLWDRPDPERAIGWLHRGEVHSESGIVPANGAGMVETGYERTHLIVWETRGDWFRVRLTEELFAWTHRCHLSPSTLKLEYVPWRSFFERHPDWLHFRRPVPHVLRTSSSPESDRVTVIGIDHKLRMLDVSGDWMEVEVEQPDLTCAEPAADGTPVLRHRGWVRWRDERGPWVFVYTRGC